MDEENKDLKPEIDFSDLSLDDFLDSVKSDVENIEIDADFSYEDLLKPNDSSDGLPSQLQFADSDDDQNEKLKRQPLPAALKVVFYVCAVLFASVVLAIGGWICAEDVLALSKPDREVAFTVKENMSINELSQSLKEKGLIDHPWLFRLYCMFSHAERKIDPGTYQLNNLYDYHALINGMIASVGERATITLTIPEGYECKDVFALLSESGVATEDQLEEAAANYPFEYDFLQTIPYGEKNRLEGYLFPDTYEFYLGDEAKNVLDKFLQNFDRKVPQELRDQVDVLNENIMISMEKNGFSTAEITNSKITLHDVVIIASLVEKESGKTSESASIASVIYNRLCSKNYPCLQIDATIQYALNERKEQLNDTDKMIVSPYNTYTNAGLPVGPIANPGINSIRAALYPATTDFYFYALGEDGTHQFSTTYYEHQDNMEQGSEGQTDAEKIETETT